MSYDAIIVGGGLGGSALGDQLARAGHHVLVLERETRFKDRVRGENILPWGIAAARRLEIYDTLIDAGGNVAPIWATYTMGVADPSRDLQATTPGGDAMLNIFHPHMQEAVLARAVSAGATVLSGAVVLGIDAGRAKSPSVTFEHAGATADGQCADRRRCRWACVADASWGGFEVQRSPSASRSQVC